MAGLRNSGVDTSRLSLPGYAGVELVVGGPRLWDPDTGIWYPAGTPGTPGPGGTPATPGTPPVGSEPGGDGAEYDPDALFGGALPAAAANQFLISAATYEEDIIPLVGPPPFAYRASFQGCVTDTGVPFAFTTVSKTDALGGVTQPGTLALASAYLFWEYDYVNAVYTGDAAFSLLFDGQVSDTWTTATVTIGSLVFAVNLANPGAVGGFTNAFTGGATSIPDPPNTEVPDLATLPAPFAPATSWTIVLS